MTRVRGRVLSATEDQRLETRDFASDTWRALRRDPGALLGLAIIALLVLVAAAAPLMAPHNPNFGYSDGLDARGFPLPPLSPGPRGKAGFALGTDGLGRDLLSRIIYGARISLLVGLLANGLSMSIGLAVGLIGGWFAGVVGSAVMRLTDIIMSVPTLLLAMALITVFRPGLLVVVVVIAVSYWTYLARMVYGEVRSIRERDFVEAARCIGAGHRRILFRYVLPNLVGVAVVYASLSAATMILSEATLSFLGIGVKPPTPSWGGMLSDGQQFLLSSPWMLLFPGLALLVTILGFNLLGDGLRDALDPRGDSRRLAQPR